MRKMTFERSPDTEAVINVLRGVNDEITYAQLARRTGLSVTRVKQVLPSARRILESDLIGFGVIRGEGLKRLAPGDKAVLTVDVLDRIGRASGRGLKRTELTDVDYNGMDKAAQHIHTGNRTIINLMRNQAKTKAQPPKPEEPKPEEPKPESAPLPNVSNLIEMGNKKAK